MGCALDRQAVLVLVLVASQRPCPRKLCVLNKIPLVTGLLSVAKPEALMKELIMAVFRQFARAPAFCPREFD